MSDIGWQEAHQGRFFLKWPYLLTGASEDADVLRRLDAGANDYVSKPFRPGELLARLHAQLRFFDNSEEAAV